MIAVSHRRYDRLVGNATHIRSQISSSSIATLLLQHWLLYDPLHSFQSSCIAFPSRLTHKRLLVHLAASPQRLPRAICQSRARLERLSTRKLCVAPVVRQQAPKPVTFPCLYHYHLSSILHTLHQVYPTAARPAYCSR